MKRRVEIGILYSRSGNYRLVSDACRAGAYSAILYEGVEGNEHAVYMHPCAHRPRQGVGARRDPFSPCAAQCNPADWHTQLTPDSTVADIAAHDFGKINPVTGPIFVEGAEPGDALKVTIEEFKPSGFGWTANIPGFGLLADDFPEPALNVWKYDATAVEPALFGKNARVPLKPFAGTIGNAPAEKGLHSVVPPRRIGGNLDIRDLAAGTTLYLPVEVAGALFSVGDTHAAQGDGEVCGTAIESPMDVVLTLDPAWRHRSCQSRRAPHAGGGGNISDRVAVMYLGQIVKMGTRDPVFSNPAHPYTRRLIEVVPVPDPAQRRRRFARLEQEIPSVMRKVGDEPSRLALTDIGGGHLVADATAIN